MPRTITSSLTSDLFHIMDEAEIQDFRQRKRAYLLSQIEPLLRQINDADDSLKHKIQTQLLRLKVICETYHADTDLCFERASKLLTDPEALKNYVSQTLMTAHFHKNKLDELVQKGLKLRQSITPKWPKIFDTVTSNDIYIRLDHPLSIFQERLTQYTNLLNADAAPEHRINIQQKENAFVVLTDNGKISRRALAFFEKRTTWIENFKKAFHRLPSEAQEEFAQIFASLRDDKELNRPAFGTSPMKQVKEEYALPEWPTAMPADTFNYLKHYLNQSHIHHTQLTNTTLFGNALTQLTDLYRSIRKDLAAATHQLSHKNAKNHLSDDTDDTLDLLILSKSPSRLARMSTYTDWDLASCRFVGHDFHHEIIDDIGAGTMIVLGFSFKKPFRPLCRSLIKPFKNEHGMPFYDVEAPYGLIISEFRQTVQHLINNTFYEKDTVLNGRYTIASNLVSENNRNLFDIATSPADYALNNQKRVFPHIKNGQPDGKTVLVGTFHFLDFYRSVGTTLNPPDWSNTLIQGTFMASGAPDFSKMPDACDKLELSRFTGNSLKEIKTRFQALSLIRPFVRHLTLTDLPAGCHTLELHLMRSPLPHLKTPALENLIWSRSEISPTDVLDFSKTEHAVFKYSSINNKTAVKWPNTLRIQGSDIKTADFSQTKDLSLTYTSLLSSFIHFPKQGDVMADKSFFGKDQTIDFSSCRKADLINCNMGTSTTLIAPTGGQLTCHNCTMPPVTDITHSPVFELKNNTYNADKHVLLLPNGAALSFSHPAFTHERPSIEKTPEGKVLIRGFNFTAGSVFYGNPKTVLFHECDTRNLSFQKKNPFMAQKQPVAISPIIQSDKNRALS